MSRKLFNYYIWHIYCSHPPSCPFITLVRFVWKISGFRYFPIHCHWSDRDQFNLSVTIFMALSSTGWFVSIFQVFATEWLNIISVCIYHSRSWNKHIFHSSQDDCDIFIESLKTRFMVLNMRYQNYFFSITEGHIFQMIKTLEWKWSNVISQKSLCKN